MTAENNISIVTQDLQAHELYKLLIGAVVPRPIAWVSSVDKKGVLNLAPFSFFGIVSRKPTTVSVTITPDEEDTVTVNKDTLNNIKETKEFVINVVPEDLVLQMDITSNEYSSDTNEFKKAGLSEMKSVKVGPPSVQESPISFECTLNSIIQIGNDYLILGEVLVININKDIYLGNYKIDYKKWKPLARVGREYAILSDVFEVKNK